MRRRAIFLALLLLANLAVFSTFFGLAQYSRNTVAFFTIAGMGVGYSCMVILWLGFVGSRGLWRYITCTALAASVALAMNWRQLSNALIPVLTVVSLTWLCYAVLLVPRHFLNWRLEIAGSPGADDHSSGKYSLKNILTFMFIVSIPLGLIQVMISIDARRTLGEFTAVSVITGVGMATVLPLAISAFARVGAKWKILASLTWCLTGMLLFATVGPASLPYVTVFHFACWASVFANLLVARALGLRWQLKAKFAPSPTSDKLDQLQLASSPGANV